MKFGKELESRANPRFRDKYVNYKALKKLLKHDAAGPTSQAASANAHVTSPSRAVSATQVSLGNAGAGRHALTGNGPAAGAAAAADSGVAAGSSPIEVPDSSSLHLPGAAVNAGGEQLAGAESALFAVERSRAQTPAPIARSNAERDALGTAAAVDAVETGRISTSASFRALNAAGLQVAAEQATAARAARSRAFLAEFDKEIAALNTFVVTEHHALVDAWRRVRAGRKAAGQDDAEHMKALLVEERDVWRKLSELRDFVELNYTACYKALKKHDKMTGSRSLERMMQVVDAQPFMAVLDPTTLDSKLNEPEFLLQADSSPTPAPPSGRAQPETTGNGDSGVLTNSAAVSDVRVFASGAAGAEAAVAEFAGAVQTVRGQLEAALQILTPELSSNETERSRRLTDFDAAMQRYSSSLQSALRNASYDQRIDDEKAAKHLRAYKLRVLRHLVVTVTNEMDLMFPEGAAALELLSHSVFTLVCGDLGASAQPPQQRRLALWRALQQQSTGRTESNLTARDDNGRESSATEDSVGMLDGSHTSAGHHSASETTIIPGEQQLESDAQFSATDSRAELMQDVLDGRRTHDAGAVSTKALQQRPKPPSLRARCSGCIRAVSTAFRYASAAVGLDQDSGRGDDPMMLDSSCRKSLGRSVYERWRPAIFEWFPEYNWRKNVLKDIVAGITIGVVLIPQGLAYATLTGLPPHYGLYTGLPAVVYALLGTSRQAAIGPMSIPSLLIAAGVSNANPPPATVEEYIGEVMAVTLMCGLLLLIMGWLNLGFIVRFISRPVLSGFTTAASILTMVSVAKDVLRAPVPRAQVLQDYVVGIAQALPHAHPASIVTAVLSMAILLLLPMWKYTKKVPAALVLVALVTAVFATWLRTSGDSGISTDPQAGPFANRLGIALVGRVPSGFPAPVFPKLSAARLVNHISTVVSVTFVGFIESIAVAKMYAVKHGYDISPASELKAVGMTNIFGSIIQSFPVMGGFSRSAVNDNAGARSQISGLISTFTVLILLLFIAPALFYLPKPALAAIIVIAVKGLIDITGFKKLWRIDKRDWLIMVAACVATLFLGVLWGVVGAMLFSVLLFFGNATQPQVHELGRMVGTVAYRELGNVGVSKVPDVKILRFMAPLFFANCTVLKDRMLLELSRRRALPPRLKWRALIIDFSSVSNIDSTSCQVLEEVLLQSHHERVPIILAGTSAFVERFIITAGLAEQLGGPKFMYRRVHDAVRAVLLRQVTPMHLPKPIADQPAQHIGHQAATSDAHSGPGHAVVEASETAAGCYRVMPWTWKRASTAVDTKTTPTVGSAPEGQLPASSLVPQAPSSARALHINAPQEAPATLHSSGIASPPSSVTPELVLVRDAPVGGTPAVVVQV